MAFWKSKKQNELSPEQIQKAVFSKTLEPELLSPELAAPAQETVTKKKRKPQDRSRLTRNRVVQIRLTEEEVTKLKATASEAKMSLADFVMACCNDKPIVIVAGAPELVVELRRHGTNLNQLVKIANENRNLQSVNIQNLAIEVAEVRQSVTDFCQKWDAKIYSSGEKGDKKNGNTQGGKQ